jgi:aspartyl-tRNA(Asn)/glutamyl-tRNA(Gln) amidotransferase subunit B
MSETSVYDKYELVVGLEIHAQLSTKSKMYCGDSAEFGAAPNSQVSPLSVGHPGTLPRVNKSAVEYAVKMGLATNCTIREVNEFARKNYFYPDLPKGYQITQDKTPICTEGYLTFEADGKEKTVRIQRIHMEEDAGKSTHDLDPYYTLVDLNRAGVPLIEIVTEPDIRTSEEAYQYVTEIRKLVRFLEICDGNMEEGSLRCDANISVRLKGEQILNTRVEVKNMNSMRNVKRAIEVEFKRQIDLVEAGGVVVQETRGFDANTGKTLEQRSKEFAHDYRYFPEPDLPPVVLHEDYIENVKTSMPKLPKQLIWEYVNHFELPEYDARVITDDKDLAFYFNDLLKLTKNYKAASNWLLGPVKSYINENGLEIHQFSLKPVKIAELIALIDEGKTNFSTASQKIFPSLVSQPEKTALQIAEELNLLQSSDEGMIKGLVEGVLNSMPEKVAEYKSGKKGLMGLFVGEVMKASKGKADPKIINKLLNELLQ